MQNILMGQVLIIKLQDAGIYPDNYEKLAAAVYGSLEDFEEELNTGDSLQFPKGTRFTMGYKVCQT